MPKEQNLDISQLLKEAGAEIDALIKTEKEQIALQKSEASMGKNKANGSVMKKEESSMKKEESSREESSMKKDEGSGYENQAPEASASASQSAAPPMADPNAPPQDGQEDQGQDLQTMVSSLDDQMLDELMQVVQMEKETRQSQQAAPQEGSQSMSQSAPPPGPDMSQMAQKSELEDTKNRLAKAEKQAQDLQQSFTSMTDLLDKMVNRPVQKAVTDVRQIEYIDKGEKALSKSEAENISDADLKKRLTEMSKDQKQLGALTKRERETLGDFFINKQRTPEILKLVSNK
jgi:hypothetical protein